MMNPQFIHRRVHLTHPYVYGLKNKIKEFNSSWNIYSLLDHQSIDPQNKGMSTRAKKITMYTIKDAWIVERPKLCDVGHKDNNCHSNKAADK